MKRSGRPLTSADFLWGTIPPGVSAAVDPATQRNPACSDLPVTPENAQGVRCHWNYSSPPV